MGKLVRIDRRYNNPYRLTPYAHRTFFKWGLLLILWVVLVSVFHGWGAIPATIALVWYAVHRIRISRGGAVKPAPVYRGIPPQYTPPAPTGFSPAPGWPAPAPGWVPEPVGERNTRTISQDVKIAVAARDGGRCRQCGSTSELHFDHVIPWSKGGSNGVPNIQLLCGPCNRRKGADDIPVAF